MPLAKFRIQHIEPFLRALPEAQKIPVSESGPNGLPASQVPQGLAHFPGQGAVVNADPHGSLVKQGIAHNGQTLPAALLDPGAHGALDPEGPGVAAVDLVQAVLFEEDGGAQIGHCPGKGALAAHAHGVAVGGQAHKAIPVPEVPQLGGIELVDGFPVSPGAKAAAPQPVAALRHKVHVRHLPQHPQSPVYGDLPAQDPGDHQAVLPDLPQSVPPVQVPRPFYGHAVIEPKAPADARGGEPHIGALHRDPEARGGGPFLQHLRAGGGIQP